MRTPAGRAGTRGCPHRHSGLHVLHPGEWSLHTHVIRRDSVAVFVSRFRRDFFFFIIISFFILFSFSPRPSERERAARVTRSYRKDHTRRSGFVQLPAAHESQLLRAAERIQTGIE